jgi:hypothetical protein
MTQKMITLVDIPKKKKKTVRFETDRKRKLKKELLTPKMEEYLANYGDAAEDTPRPDNISVSRDDLDSILSKIDDYDGTTKPADGDTSTKKGVRVPKKGRYVITGKKGDTITFQLKQ